MTQVITFNSYAGNEGNTMMGRINKWLTEYKNQIDIVDIKYTANYAQVSDTKWVLIESAMIIYKMSEVI